MVAFIFILPDWVIQGLAIPLSPIWVPVYCIHKAYRCVRPYVPREEEAYRKRTKNRPRSLPSSREFNTSTVSLPETTIPSSPLLRLPYSVRCEIYKVLFLNRYVFYLTLRSKRIVHIHKLYSDYWKSNDHIRSQMLSHPPPDRYCSETRIHHLDLELLRTCRTIYQEAHPLVYRSNTFAFRELETLIYFNRCVRPQHLAMIRYLQLDWNMPYLPHHSPVRPYDRDTWARVWTSISTRMTGLEAMKLTVYIWTTTFEPEQSWLGEVVKVRGLKRFVLDISYPVYLDRYARELPTTEAMADYRNYVVQAVKTVDRATQTSLASQSSSGSGNSEASGDSGDSEGSEGSGDSGVLE